MQRRGRGSAHRLRRSGTRLTGRQVHQIAVATLALRGRQPDVHHVERWDPGAQRDPMAHVAKVRALQIPAGASIRAPAPAAANCHAPV